MTALSPIALPAALLWEGAEITKRVADWMLSTDRFGTRTLSRGTIPAALAYACSLDRQYRALCSGTGHTEADWAALYALEDLAQEHGGESFADALVAHMDWISERLQEEHPREVWPQMEDDCGGLSSWLENKIAADQDHAARAWMDETKATLARVSQGASVAMAAE